MTVNQKFIDYLLELSSKKPTPGGGSAMALAGALAASLVAKVAIYGALELVRVNLPLIKNNKPELKLRDEMEAVFSGIETAIKNAG